MSYSDTDSESDNDNNINNDQTILETFYNGSIYHPAGTHYRPIGERNDIIVQCDNCMMSISNACIGYKSVDLCLRCYEEIDIELHGSYVRSDSYYNIFHDMYKTANYYNAYLEKKGMYV